MPERTPTEVITHGLIDIAGAIVKLAAEVRKTPTSVDDTPPPGASEEPWELAETLYKEWCPPSTITRRMWVNLSNAEKKRWLRIADKALDYMG